ncbi:MAG: prepilin-type N-terminal cleavage/methylation domain-containing protein [Candidatus Levybacteria bacterium]|nr:prepilin-type N-terminal cleavage/methylation domain-containing protein [Candidatus Levybacteria bacterium]
MSNKNFGFTLIELLIVIAIIGVLASGVLVAINPLGQVTKAKDSIRRGDIRQISNALEAYYVFNSSYPSTGGALWAEGRCTYSGWTIKPNYSGPDAYIPNLAPQELKVLPGDPSVDGSIARCYAYMSDGTFYVLIAHNGAEAPFKDDDPMIRQYSYPACNNIQGTFIIRNDGTRCW